MNLTQDELDVIAKDMNLTHEGLYLSDGDIRNNCGRIVVYDFSEEDEVEDENMLRRILSL